MWDFCRRTLTPSFLAGETRPNYLHLLICIRRPCPGTRVQYLDHIACIAHGPTFTFRFLDACRTCTTRAITRNLFRSTLPRYCFVAFRLRTIFYPPTLLALRHVPLLAPAQSVGRLSASPMEKFMSGLEKMMTGPQLEGSMDTPQEQEQQEEPQDMSAFRESLIRQSRLSRPLQQ